MRRRREMGRRMKKQEEKEQGRVGRARAGVLNKYKKSKQQQKKLGLREQMQGGNPPLNEQMESNGKANNARR